MNYCAYLHRYRTASKESARFVPSPKFALSGEGLNIGRDGPTRVTQAYAGERPWELTRATIKEVILDVSDEGIIDPEQQAVGAFWGLIVGRPPFSSNP